MPGSKAAQVCRPQLSWSEGITATFVDVSERRTPVLQEMDSIFNRFHRDGHGSGLDARVHASAENSGLLFRTYYFLLFGRYVLWIAAVSSRPAHELCVEHCQVDVSCGDRNLSSDSVQ